MKSPISLAVALAAVLPIVFLATPPVLSADGPGTDKAASVPRPVSAAPGSVVHAPSYEDTLRMWQSRRRQNLTAPAGWLSVAGFFWLEPGENRFGTAADNRVVLPPGTPAVPEYYDRERYWPPESLTRRKAYLGK